MLSLQRVSVSLVDRVDADLILPLIVQGETEIRLAAMTRSFTLALLRAASAAPVSYYYPREAGTS
jgi:hypothetical protein